jgi:hypothetical protein
MAAGPIWGTGVPRACPGGCHDRAVTVPLAIADACADTDTDCAAHTPPRVSVATSATYLSGASAPRATRYRSVEIRQSVQTLAQFA